MIPISDQLLYGAVVLAANSPTQPFKLYEGGESGAHFQSRFTGFWYTYSTYEAEVMSLPQRDKLLRIDYMTEEPLYKSLSQKLSQIDSQYEGSRHLNKLHRLQEELDAEDCTNYAVMINNASSHGYFAFLSRQIPIYLYGMVSTVNGSVQLLWSTEDDVVDRVRSLHPLRYVFFRFPPIIDRPVFLPTQAVCSHWWRWTSSFQSELSMLRAFNALDVRLFKDPTLVSLASDES
ncbi:hypothetical protein [Burkholderia phage BCSR5]|nr:hypothetical protein [Burkholderia phage BCSR5]